MEVKLFFKKQVFLSPFNDDEENYHKNSYRGTGGYDEKYSSGFASSQIAEQIRGINSTNKKISSECLLKSLKTEDVSNNINYIANNQNMPVEDNVKKLSKDDKNSIKRELLATMAKNPASGGNLSNNRNKEILHKQTQILLKQEEKEFSNQESKKLKEHYIHQKKTYTNKRKQAFIFGAGLNIITKKFSLQVPSAFTYKEKIYNQEIIAFSVDNTIKTLEGSPIEIWVEHIPLLKKRLICDFYQMENIQAHITNRLCKEVVVSGSAAFLSIEENKKAKSIIARVDVLCYNQSDMYRLKMIFHKDFENINSIVQRIYSNFKILE